MLIPKTKILPNGTKVEYKTTYKGEDVVLEGFVTGNGAKGCMYRTLKDLVYYVKEDIDDTNMETVHHEDIQEIIECPHCSSDLLTSGIDEQVWVTHSYDKDTRKTVNEISSELENHIFNCAYCGEEVSRDKIERLQVYLDI